MYLSGHWILSRKYPPDWAAYAALSIRELLDHLLNNQIQQLAPSGDQRALAEGYIRGQMDANVSSASGSAPRDTEIAISERTNIFLFIKSSRPDLIDARVYALVVEWSLIVRGLNPIIHRRSLRDGLSGNEREREVDDQVKRTDTILFEFFLDPGFYTKLKEVDELMLLEEPSETELLKLIALFSTPELENYFFANCKNVAWLPLLETKKYFETGQDAMCTKREDGASIYKYWQPAKYLITVAKEDAKSVLRIVSTIVDQGNPYIIDDILRIFLNVELSMENAKFCVALIKKRKWHCVKLSLIIEDRLGQYLSYVSKLDSEELSFQIVSLLLAFECEETPHVVEGMRSFREAKSIYNDWQFENMVREHILPLKVKFPAQLLRSFIKRLNACIKAENKTNRIGKIEDYSTIWFSRLDGIEPHHRADYKNVLITSIIEIGKYIIEHPEMDLKVQEIFDATASTPVLDVIKRLKTYFAFLEGDVAIASSLMMDPDYIFCFECENEMHLLLGKLFSQLSNAEQSLVIGLLESPHPHIDEARGDLRYTWSLHLLMPIVQFLPPAAKARFDAFQEKYGAPTPRRQEIVSWVGPTSDKTKDQLLSMKPDELISYLLTYLPGGNQFHPYDDSCDGLGRELQEAVSADPQHFDFLFEAIPESKIPSIYAYYFLQGLQNALRGGTSISWDRLVVLLDYLTRSDNWPHHDSKPSDFGVEWISVQRQAASLLSIGFANEKSSLTLSFRDIVWDVLVRLIKFNDPSPEDDASLKGDDPHIVAINTTRGEALNALISYGLWLARMGGVDKEQENRMEPRLQVALEEILDPVKEPSPSVRFIFGQRIPNLSYLNKSWLFSLKKRIFPDNNALFWLAAFQGYMANSTFLPLDEWLKDQYPRAIEYLATKDKTRSNFSPSDVMERLFPQHILIAYTHGVLEESVIIEFFNRVDVSLRIEAISFVGHQILTAAPLVGVEGIERIIKLWDLLLANAQQPLEVFAELGGWFLRPSIPTEKRLDCLLKTVKRTSGWIDDADDVLEELVHFVPTEPLKVAEIMSEVLLNEKSAMRTLGYRLEGTRALMIALRDSGNREAKIATKKLLDELGRKGHHQKFLDLAGTF